MSLSWAVRLRNVQRNEANKKKYPFVCQAILCPPRCCHNSRLRGEKPTGVKYCYFILITVIMQQKLFVILSADTVHARFLTLKLIILLSSKPMRRRPHDLPQRMTIRHLPDWQFNDEWEQCRSGLWLWRWLLTGSYFYPAYWSAFNGISGSFTAARESPGAELIYMRDCLFFPGSDRLDSAGCCSTQAGCFSPGAPTESAPMLCPHSLFVLNSKGRPQLF